MIASTLPEFDRSKYPEAWLRLGLLEAAVQRHVLTRLAARRCWTYVVDSGAARLHGRVAQLARQHRIPPGALGAMATGMNRGIVDVHGITFEGRPVHIEVKAPAWLVLSPKTRKLVQKRAAGEATPEQVAFVLAARRAGSAAGFAWGPVDVDRILDGVPTCAWDLEHPAPSRFVNAWDAVHEHGERHQRDGAEATTAGRAYLDGVAP